VVILCRLLFGIGFHLGPVVIVEQIVKIIVEVGVDVLIVRGQMVHHHSCSSAGLKGFKLRQQLSSVCCPLYALVILEKWVNFVQLYFVLSVG